MYERFGKRTLDLAVAIPAIIIATPVMVIVAVWVKLDSEGDVLFKQLRSGKDRAPFTVYKFRSMAISAPSNMATNSFKDAGAYITRSGKILRKLSLDELPQLINVLKGDMSIVGPRPVVLAETNLLDLREQYGANSVKPGITGWAQVNGRDELNDIMKARMDGQYVERFGVRTDVKCLLLTVGAVLSLSGHAEGHERADDDELDVSVAEKA